MTKNLSVHGPSLSCLCVLLARVTIPQEACASTPQFHLSAMRKTNAAREQSIRASSVSR
jgi:hypothetical protein